MSKSLGFLVVVLLAVACEPRSEVTTGRTAEQQEVARRACIATELVRTSDEEIDLIEASLPAGVETSPEVQAMYQTQISALRFAQALYDHALLRHGALAHADSALNHARGAADSTRHVESAAAYSIRAPERGSIEANAIVEYERRFARISADGDHRCNWDI
jgi:hypothetical protein